MALDIKIKVNSQQISKRYNRLQSRFPRIIDKGLLQGGVHLLDIIRTKTANKKSPIIVSARIFLLRLESTS